MYKKLYDADVSEEVLKEAAGTAEVCCCQAGSSCMLIELCTLSRTHPQIYCRIILFLRQLRK